MENKQIKTTNGYTAVIRPFLTYDQYIDIQKVWTQHVLLEVGAETPEKAKEDAKKSISKVPANTMYEANRLAVSFLVVKILNPEGVEIKRQPHELPVPPLDGKEIMDFIDKLTSEAQEAFGKKKAKA